MITTAGMLSFAEAREICPLFSATERDTHWPATFPLSDLVNLQQPMPAANSTLADAHRNALTDALIASCKLGLLPCTADSAAQAERQQIAAKDFATWLSEQNRAPSEHVIEWLRHTSA